MTQAQAVAARALMRAQREYRAAEGAVQAALLEVLHSPEAVWLEAVWCLGERIRELRAALGDVEQAFREVNT